MAPDPPTAPPVEGFCPIGVVAFVWLAISGLRLATPGGFTA
jgi:hypothetical protein